MYYIINENVPRSRASFFQTHAATISPVPLRPVMRFTQHLANLNILYTAFATLNPVRVPNTHRVKINVW